jgi:hypothetical protein
MRELRRFFAGLFSSEVSGYYFCISWLVVNS